MKKIFICLAVSLFSFVASAQEKVDGKVPVATGKYITGGVLGSTIGFGIGHAVQGRYEDKGWIFTATESAGLVLLIAGCSSTKRNSDGDKECSNPGLSAVGLITLIGFHVWEIVDIWSTATPVEDRPAVMLLPNPEAPGIGIAWKF